MNQAEWMHLTSQMLILAGTFILYRTSCHIARVWSEMRAELLALRAEQTADDTPLLVLAELRKHTTLLEVIAKQGEHAAQHFETGRPLRVIDVGGLPG